MSEKPAAESEPGTSFLQEFGWYWQRWPGKPLWFALLIAWLVLFQFLGNSTFGYIDTHSLFGWMVYSYREKSDDEHGFLVPIVVLILLWWKRRELLEAARDIWWPALGCVLLALVIHLVAYAIQQTRISILAFFFGMYGLMGLVWGRQFMVRTFFPMILFVFCVPLSTVNESITYPLRTLVAKITVLIGHGILAMPIAVDGSRIIGPDGVYDVATACSGIRSLTMLGAVTMIYGFVSFTSYWKRILILLAAIPLAVAGNVARVTTVVILGDVFGRDWALRVEQYLGLVTFTVALICLFTFGYWIKESREPRLPEAA